jgi:hypothetical protein
VLSSRIWSYIGIGGVVVSLFLLISTGMADDDESARTFLLAASIVLGASIVAQEQ